MFRPTARQLILTCSLCDVAGTFTGGLLLAVLSKGFYSISPYILFAFGLVYIFFGWLYGSYTIMRAKWLHGPLLLFRLFLIAFSCALFFLLVAWLANQTASFHPVLDRSWFVLLLAWQTAYGFLIRRSFHALLLRISQPDWQLLAQEEEYQEVIRQWGYTPLASLPRRFIDPASEHRGHSPESHSISSIELSSVSEQSLSFFAVGSSNRQRLDQSDAIRTLKDRGINVRSLEQMAQFYLERLPPTLLPEQWMNYSDLRWSNDLSFQRKLKRAADIFLALVLLLFASPFLFLAAISIFIEDRGPVLYIQKRTGWRNQVFSLYKLRTMRQSSPDTPTPWTSYSDKRITRVGSILRKTRLDEVPQLINVMRGEMSLIGPRPEQPHFDLELAEHIPHYYKRYWMPPGLSGWAQVCGPAYPSTLEEAELKLSYDLFYLRHWNVFLDILIFAKTLKTLLKVKGR